MDKPKKAEHDAKTPEPTPQPLPPELKAARPAADRPPADARTSPAGKTPWDQIAASAYRAYARSVDNKTHLGHQMPDWDHLTDAVRTAWEAAVRQADSVVWCDRCEFPLAPDDRARFTDEKRWSDWTPPK